MKSAKSGPATQEFHRANKTMGVMDFLKGLFSSKQEDQGLNNISDSGSIEPAPEEPKVEEGIDNQGGTEDLNIQE